VRDLHHGELAAGRHSWAWNARDARGARVRSGVYFVRASDGVTSRTQRVVVVD
jgi:flagellar hook assembly protein FlgD